MQTLLSDLFWSFVGTIALGAFVYFVYFVAKELFADEFRGLFMQEKNEQGDGE